VGSDDSTQAELKSAKKLKLYIGVYPLLFQQKKSRYEEDERELTDKIEKNGVS
jgi:hypothetical protein